MQGHEWTRLLVIVVLLSVTYSVFRFRPDLNDGSLQVAHEVDVPTIGPPPLPLVDPSDYIRRYIGEAKDATRVLLVASAIGGPVASGGIAAAFRHLVDHLKTDGRLDVAILYCAHPSYSEGDENFWRQYFAKDNVKFIILPRYESEILVSEPSLGVRSYRIFRWLRDHQDAFDVVHFHDYMGNGYFSVLAKHQGLFFHRIRFVAQLHSVLQWADQGNFRAPGEPEQLASYHMERLFILYADVRISPSETYMQWLHSTGAFNMSTGPNFVIQNTLYPLPHPISSNSTRPPTRHFAFFGRLEVRKGLIVFLDAVDQLLTTGSLPDAVSFVGMETMIGKESALDLINRRTKAWPFEVKIITTLSSTGAQDYIRSIGAVAIMPVFVENSPYAVLEMIAAGIPFITTNNGGAVELIDQSSLSTCGCVVPVGDALALKDALARAVQVGIGLALPRVAFSRTVQAYKDISIAVAADPSLSIPRSNPRNLPSISVVVYGQGDAMRTSKSVADQHYALPLVRLHVEGHGSRDDIRKDVQAKGLKFSLLTNVFSTEQVEKMTSDFVCYFRSGSVLDPNALATMANVTYKTGADVISFLTGSLAHPNSVVGIEGRLPIGHAVPANFFKDYSSCDHFCIRKSRFLSLSMSETEFPQSICLKAAIMGYATELVPLPLVKVDKNSEFVGKIDISAFVPTPFVEAIEYCQASMSRQAVPAFFIP